MIDPGAVSVIGIDQALRHTGIAVWRDGRLSYQTVHTNPDDSYEARIRWITGNVWPLITRRTFVVLETPFVSGNSATSMALSGLYFILRYGLYARSVPFGSIGNSTLKKFATGNGNADKASMVQMAAATFGPGAKLRMGGWAPDQDTSDVDAFQHEADALWAMTAGLYHVYLSGFTHENEDLAHVMEPGLSHEQQQVHERATGSWPQIEWQTPAP